MRLLYNILANLLLPFLFIRLWWKGRLNPGYRRRWAERLAFFKTPSLKSPIWVHAVSFGEMIVAAPLVREIQKHFPEHSIVITTMTSTGSAQAQKQFKPEEAFHVFVPYDTPGAVKRFLSKIKPCMLILIETELWPNQLHYCQQQKIPVLLANARLSEKSARSYARFSKITKTMLSAVSMIAAQAKPDADRFVALGADPKRVVVTGSIKFDINDPERYRDAILKLKAQCNNRLVWIAGSTHAGEDDIILAAHAVIKKQFPTSLLFLVPRHPERFMSVTELCRSSGFTAVRRSEQGDNKIESDIYVGDTMGEMMILYGASDVVFVGGSFITLGGHNMLEPAALAKPVITGPHVFNFAQVTELLLSAGALIQVRDAETLAHAVIGFFEDENKIAQAGARALSVVEANRGALMKHVGLLDIFCR